MNLVQRFIMSALNKHMCLSSIAKYAMGQGLSEYWANSYDYNIAPALRDVTFAWKCRPKSMMGAARERES